MCDAEPVQCRAAQSEDVEGLVGEEIAGVLVALQFAGHAALCPVGRAAAVGVEQSAEEWPRVGVDDVLLPLLEHDVPCVLGAGPVLREQAHPVDGMAPHVGAAVRCRCEIDDVGSTTEIAAATSSRTPGQLSAQVIVKRQVRCEWTIAPSPRYCPSR